MKKHHLRVTALALLLLLVVGAAAASVAPDLRLAGVTANRVNAAAGEQIAVTARVENAGSVAAAASRLKYYFSVDAVFDTSDSYLNYDNVGALAGGGFEDETANVRVPAGTADGAYFIVVIADFDGDVIEIDESNNSFALPVVVGDISTTEGPDLYVSDVALSTSRAQAGEVVAASCSVANAGNASSVQTRLKYYLSTDTIYDGADRYLNYDAVAALPAGGTGAESANLRVPAGTADGSYYVLFVADQTAVAAETNEQNNIYAEALFVGDAGPDLLLVDATIAAPNVRSGDTLSVSTTVRNGGDADADASRLVYFLSTDSVRDAGDKQLSFDAVGALAAGASGTEDAALRISAATVAGSYFVLFVLDADDNVSETDEGNNVVAIPVLVTGDDPDAIKPDLVVSGATLGAPIVAAGDKVLAAATVVNLGVASATSSRLKYYLSSDTTFDAADRYLNYDNVGDLAVGATSPESANLRIPVATADGDYFVLFVADETRDVAEQLESNNVVAVAVAVGDPGAGGPIDSPDAALPDLMVSSASVESIAVMAGERVSLSCTVENVGNYDAADSSRVKYYLSRDGVFDASDDYVGYDNVGALAAAELSPETATPRIPALTTHGRWYLLVVADAAEQVAETFESNNVASVAIDVVVDDPSLDAADLVADNPMLDKATVGAGYKLDVAVNVENIGSQPAASSRLKLYLSEDDRHDDGDDFLGYRQLPSLAVGENMVVGADVRIPFMTAPGSAYVVVVLDSERVVTEPYESNNELAIPVTVGTDEGGDPAYPYACPDSVFTDATLLPKNTVAALNALHLGYNNGKDMTALACIVSHFDLVGLVEVDNPEGVAELEQAVESVTGQAWSTHVSAQSVGNANSVEFYAFIWRDAEVSMTGSLGFFDDSEDLIKREPYGANFRMGAFDFTYVVFHLQYGNSISTRRFEAQQLRSVYDYFQAQNGAENDLLIGGDFNLPGNDNAFSSLLAQDGVTYVTDPEQKTTLGNDGPANSFDNIFYPADYMSELIGTGAHDYTMGNWDTVIVNVTDHIPVWAAFDTTIDDD